MPNAQAVLNLQGRSIINGESKAGAGATFMASMRPPASVSNPYIVALQLEI